MKRLIILFAMFVFSFYIYAYQINYIEETNNYLEFEIDLSDLSIKQNSEFTEIELPDGTNGEEYYAPDVPFIVLNFAIPKDGNISVEMQEFSRKSQIIDKPIKPIGRHISGNFSKIEYKIDPQKYVSNRNLYQVLPKESLNMYDFIPLKLNPIHYDHSRSEVFYPEKILVKVKILGNIPRNQLFSSKDQYVSFFTNQKNYTNFRIHRDKKYHSSNFSRAKKWFRFEVSQDGMFVIDYQFLSSVFTANDFKAVDPKAVRIFSTGGMMMRPDFDNSGNDFLEIPLLITGGESGEFTNQTRIYFYAEDRDDLGKNSVLTHSTVGDYVYNNLYSKNGVYWLTWGSNNDFGNSPKRMTTSVTDNVEITRSTGKNSLHLEDSKVWRNWESEQYIYSNVVNLGNDFIWNNVYLEDIETSSEQVLSVVTAPTNDNSHRFIINVNNGPDVINYSMYGYVPRLVSAKGFFFNEGNNTITYKSQLIGGQRFKYYHIEYQQKLIKRNKSLFFMVQNDDLNKNVKYGINNINNQNLTVFQINSFSEANLINLNSNSFNAKGSEKTKFYICSPSDFLQPISITEYQESRHLDSDIKPHDVMIIYPKSFQDGAKRLSTIYTKYCGYTVDMVSLEAVMDNYSGGHLDPIAIRNYLHAIQLELVDSPPLGAVFIGTGTQDYRELSGPHSMKKNHFPINLIWCYRTNSSAITYITRITSDDFYGHFNTHKYPEVVLGRIPATSAETFKSYLDKLEEYYQNPKPGWWQNTALLLADDFVSSTYTWDSIHSEQVESFSNIIKDNIIVDKVFAETYPMNAFKRKPEVNNLVMSKINDGRIFWLYVGHGSTGNNGDEHYFNISDVPLLTNKGKYPIYFAASCNVGQYDIPNLICLAERLSVSENSGSIVSIAATRATYSSPNGTFLTRLLRQVFNDREENESIGVSVMLAKNKVGVNAVSDASDSGSLSGLLYFALMGDPFLILSLQSKLNTIRLGEEDKTFKVREMVSGNGEFLDKSNVKVAQIRAYDNGYKIELMYKLQGILTDLAPVLENLPIFKGSSSISNSEFSFNFNIPDKSTSGKNGKVLALAIDDKNKVYMNRLNQIPISFETAEISSDSSPEIVKLYIDNEGFKEGDTVTPNPTFYTEINDPDGINTIGLPGRKMIIHLKTIQKVIDVTAGFEYELDSFTRGTLVWKLSDLPQGNHDLEFVVYDCFGDFTVAKTNFIVSQNIPIQIINPLLYPNPMKNEGYFTFYLSHEADVSISIFTITGRKIKTINKIGCNKDYNQIHWDGRDIDGHRIANNTYFYKITARATQGSGKAEITDKLIILK